MTEGTDRITALNQTPQAGLGCTGVVLTDPVHPNWYPAIRNTLVLTLCVRVECHRFIGGFRRDPNLLTLRVEDMLCASLLSETFQHLLTDRPTVRLHRIPGNMFDRHYGRFTQPPEAGVDVLSLEEEALRPQVLGRHDWSLALIRHRSDLLSRCFRPTRPA
ncbi:hypothetical protein [Azospirillum brasilense]|uniref:Uncharacterized protein n=1 Tax=Azospirillum brasilense TaxID=192 RepID=A0A6L3B7Y2_AZOBR|nr:hypothetical protein [Azospirillum brasilense]KAA0687573.1 hypothetical protein DS837_04940 [Azospirillum brasilense]